MKPLDLTKAPPRSPREELCGLCMLPRMIEIARATLPGGSRGQYQIGRAKSLSAAVLKTLRVSETQFLEVVQEARTDDDVARRLWPANPPPLAELNLRLRRITVAEVPPELQPDFQRFYGADLPPDRRVFDILEADDTRCFPKTA